MSRDKQTEIEEMAKAVCHLDRTCDECMTSFECKAMMYAKRFYNAGYRKAFDLVNEIFADVFKAIRKYYIEAEHTKSVTCELMLDYLKGDLAELKKKYESEKDNG